MIVIANRCSRFRSRHQVDVAMEPHHEEALPWNSAAGWGAPTSSRSPASNRPPPLLRSTAAARQGVEIFSGSREGLQSGKPGGCVLMSQPMAGQGSWWP